TFSEDPYRGMTSESFAGSAVGFTRTVTFGPPRTASLRQFCFPSRGDRWGVAPQVGETLLAANRVRAPTGVIPCSQSSVQHAGRMHVVLENRLLLAPFIGILLAQPHDHAQRLDVKAIGLGFGINVANVVGDRFFLFLQPLDALHEGLQMILREAGGGPIHGSGGGHRNPPPVTRAQGFGSAGAEVKTRGQSSPEYTGEEN